MIRQEAIDFDKTIAELLGEDTINPTGTVAFHGKEVHLAAIFVLEDTRYRTDMRVSKDTWNEVGPVALGEVLADIVFQEIEEDALKLA